MTEAALKKYNPAQPRDPGGEHGGQWVKEPGGLPDLPAVEWLPTKNVDAEGKYHVFHGTSAENAREIRQSGTLSAPKTVGGQWYMLTTNREEAKAYSRDGTVLEFAIPAKDAQRFLFPPSEAGTYGGQGVSDNHALRHPLPTRYLLGRRSAAVVRLVEVNGRRVAVVQLEEKFRPDQPRDPHTGEWIKEGVSLTPWEDLVHTVGRPIDCGDDVNKAARLITQGKAVRLDQPSTASTLLDRLAAISKDAERQGKKAPNYDLCKVSVKGHNLFCAQSKGVPRVKMPQLAGKPLPGSKADKLPKNDKGEVDAGPEFLTYLRNRGIPVYEGHLPAANLRATQDELNGPKVAAIMDAKRRGKVEKRRLFVSRDNYIVDGHHSWAADVALDSEDNALGDITADVNKVDIPIPVVLAYAKQFAREYGLPQVGVDDKRGHHGDPPVLPEAAPKHVFERVLDGELFKIEDRAGLPKGQGSPFERLQVYGAWLRQQRAEAKEGGIGDQPFGNLAFLRRMQELQSEGRDAYIKPPQGLGRVLQFFYDHEADLLDIADGVTHFIGTPIPIPFSPGGHAAQIEIKEFEGRDVALVRLKFNPDQPRDPHTGEWVKEPGARFLKEQASKIDTIFLDPYHTTPERRASPQFKPRPKPSTQEQAREKQPGGQLPAYLTPQISTRIAGLQVGEQHRFPEGTLVEVEPHGKGQTYRVDGPDGTFWRLPREDAARLTEFEETTARANRFGTEIPGNPMVPLPGVDVPPEDPIGDTVGGILHGGFATLPRGTVVHRRPGTAGDFFDITSPTGTQRSFPATRKDEVVATAREFEKQAEGRIGGAASGKQQARTTKVTDPNGPLQPLSPRFRDTRVALHAESERVLGYQHAGNEIALVQTPGGFGTPEFRDTDGKLTSYRVEGAETVVTKDGKDVLRDPIGPAADSKAAKQLADFYDVASRVLQDLRKQGVDPGGTVADRFDAPILWPEHFDIAVELGKGNEHRANFGASPGDEHHPEPYFYVGPWAPKKKSSTWNADGFNGAELSYADVLAAPDQEKAIRDFYLEHLKALGAQKAAKKFDPNEPRDPHGRWTETPATRMFATPARSEREHADAYYATPRWKQFATDVHRQAQDLGIDVVDEQRTQGIWSQLPEPSATYTLRGGNPDQLAARIGKKWNQDAVLTFKPGDGPDAEYHFKGAAKGNSTLKILKTAEANGLFGATRNGDDIVVVVGPEMGGEDEKALERFGEALGADTADRYPGTANLIEREEYESLEGKSQEALAASGVRRHDDDTHRQVAEGEAPEEALEALVKYNPAQPRDPGGEHGGQWIKINVGDAISKYQDGWSSVVNHLLRGIDPTAEPWMAMAYSDEQANEAGRLVPALDKAVKDGPETPRHLYRGVDLSDAPGLSEKLHKGNTFRDGGFLSTSANEEVANNFTGASQIRDPIVMKVTVPKGTHGFEPGGYETEAEFVLARGGHFKVTSDPYEESYFGVKIHAIDVEWSPPTPTENRRSEMPMRDVSKMSVDELQALQEQLDRAPASRVTQMMRERVNIELGNRFGEMAAPR